MLNYGDIVSFTVIVLALVTPVLVSAIHRRINRYPADNYWETICVILCREIFSVACSRFRDSGVREIEKARTRK